MIIKVISTQGKDENGKPLYYIEDTDKIPKSYLKTHLQFLKTNKDAKLLDYEILEK